MYLKIACSLCFTIYLYFSAVIKKWKKVSKNSLALKSKLFLQILAYGANSQEAKFSKKNVNKKNNIIKTE